MNYGSANELLFTSSMAYRKTRRVEERLADTRVLAAYSFADSDEPPYQSLRAGHAQPPSGLRLDRRTLREANRRGPTDLSQRDHAHR